MKLIAYGLCIAKYALAEVARQLRAPDGQCKAGQTGEAMCRAWHPWRGQFVGHIKVNQDFPRVAHASKSPCP